MAGGVGAQQPDAAPSDPPVPETETTHPALGLSKAFDSFDATMRLAALTGMEKDLDKFSETQKIARLKKLADAKRAAAASASALSASATWQNAAPAQRLPAPGFAAAQLKLIWLGSALLAVAATVLFFLH
jgi:hypothetical protein